MTRQIQYHILFPKQNILFDTGDLTFSIGNIRSRRPSVLLLRFHCFDMDDELLYTHTSDRSVIGTVYEFRQFSINLSDEILADTVYTQIELITMGVDSENPLYFNRCMLQTGDYSEYHTPSEVIESYTIGFHNNTYANLYSSDGNYLQVIRPNKESLHTDILDKARVSILAPHFEDDKDFDDDVAVFIEAMNQREQTIDVLR